MLNHVTKDKLMTLGLKGFMSCLETQLDSFYKQSLSIEEALGILLDAEVTSRNNLKIIRLLKNAKLRYANASLEDIQYSADRAIKRDVIHRFAGCQWINENKNIIISGATGTGKTWLGCAFGVQACRLSYHTLYFNAHQLFEELSLAHADGTLSNLRKKLINTQLLIIDDFGLSGIDLSLAPVFLDIIDRQSSNGSLLLTSQYPPSVWHSQFNDPTIADAILDRIVHRSHFIEVQGGSMRKRLAKKDL